MTTAGYSFGPFRLDCRRRELRRGDELVVLTPKAFDLLRVLATAGDRVIEKQELLQLVWPNSFVTDDSLTQHIAALRKALGDTPDRPAYILTVPRHGYRFIAVVRQVLEERADQAMSTPPDPTSETKVADQPINGVDDSGSVDRAHVVVAGLAVWRSTRAWIAASAVIILTVVALAGRMLLRSAAATKPDVVRFTISAPEGTAFSASASSLAVSPDGRLLAFLAYRPGKETRIWVRSLDSLRARELIGTDGALGPFWSPDSQSLAFVVHDQLKTVGLLGDPPRTLCDLQHGNTPSGTWNRDGVILVSDGNAISRISATGGVPTPVTSVDVTQGEKAHSLPQFLPDGRHFIYLSRGTVGGPINSWIVLASLDGSEHRQLIRATSQAVYADPGYLVFLQNGALMAQPFDAARLQLQAAPVPVTDVDHVGFNPNTPRGMFTVSETGRLAYRLSAERQLGWFDRTGRPLGWIGAAGLDSNPALSPDGRHLAIGRYDPETATSGVWILDLEHNGIASAMTPHRMWANCPVWSPDGSRIVFVSGETATGSSVYEKNLTEPTEDRVLAQHLNACPLDWSHDGQFVLYSTSREAGLSESSLWLFAFDGRNAPKPVFSPWPRSIWARIAPNGQWMAYVSDTTGRYEVYVRSLPPREGGPWRVSSNGGIDPQWRADGQELFFIGADGQLMAVPVTTDGRFEARTPTALFLTGLDPVGIPGSGRNQYAVSADGTRFLLNQPRSDAVPAAMAVVLNWQSALGTR